MQRKSLWVLLAMGFILLLNGCGSKQALVRLQNYVQRQATVIKRQQTTIAQLRAKIKRLENINRKLHRHPTTKLGPTANQDIIGAKKSSASATPHLVHQVKKPIKKIKLKKVEDKNYDPNYMYPDSNRSTKKRKKKSAKKSATHAATSNAMSKSECIGMIGESKFQRYAQIFGSESAAIKRCAMLKAMQR